jgi:ankyrin repeat protein
VPLTNAIGKNHTDIKAVADVLLTDSSLVPDLDLDHRRPMPLSWAAQGGYDTVVELLLNSMHEPSEDILLKAAERGHMAIVKLIVQNDKVSLEAKTVKEETALWLAAHNGREAIVKLLLEACKVDVDAKDNHGDTPLFRALVHGHENVAKLLLETGKVDVNTKNSLGETPLTRLASMGRDSMIRLLLESSNVDVNLKGGRGQAPLAHAACNGHENVVRLLLGTGKVNVNAKDDFEHTALSRVLHGQQAYKPSQEEMDRVENEFGHFHEAPNTGKGHEAIIALLRKREPKSKAIPSSEASRSRSIALKLKRIGHGM